MDALADEVYIHEKGASNTEFVLMESGTLFHVLKSSLSTPRVEQGLEHVIVVTSEPLEFLVAVCQIVPSISSFSESL